MRTALLFLLGLLALASKAQNLIANSDFESNGQPLCTNWFNYCGHEITFLCAGDTDSSCSYYFGCEMHPDAPPGGGQWCLKMSAFTSALNAYAKTYITGQFKGVYECKVWYRSDTTGMYPSVYIYYKKGNNYTGMNSIPMSFSQTWKSATLRDTIQNLSDTIIIALVSGVGSSFEPGRNAFLDLPEFRMLESWTDVESINQISEVSLFPNPFSSQLNFKTANNEPTTVSLFNFLGLQVLQETFTNTTTLSTAQLASGIYFYELRSRKEVMATGKVVKE